MDHYKKSSQYKECLVVRMLGLKEDTYALTITPESSVCNIVPYASQLLKVCGQILFIGCGSSADKAIEYAEKAKKRYKALEHVENKKNTNAEVHQVTEIMYKKIEEFWDPSEEGMNTLKVVREIPAIAILLSVLKPSQDGPKMERVIEDQSCIG